MSADPNAIGPPRRKCRVAHLVYSENLGGSETAAAEICRRLDRSRFESCILMMFPGPGPLPDYLTQRSLRFYQLHNCGVRRFANPLYLAARLRWLRLDVLHIHHIPLYTYIWRAARWARIPIVGCTEHAKYSISRSLRLQDGCRHAARHADFLVTVSHELKEYFVRELRVPTKAVRVIPNGVDTSVFHPADGGSRGSSGAAGRPAGGRLISVGRLVEAKDYPSLFSALALLRSAGRAVDLLLVGDGELREVLAREAAGRGLSDCVAFCGSRTDVPELLRAADVFVLSSRREGLPIVVLEAMASGLPVAATRVGAISEVVRDGEDGLLVPPGDPPALAAALARLLDDGELRARLSRHARNSVLEGFALDQVVRRYEELYERGTSGAAQGRESMR